MGPRQNVYVSMLLTFFDGMFGWMRFNLVKIYLARKGEMRGQVKGRVTLACHVDPVMVVGHMFKYSDWSDLI